MTRKKRNKEKIRLKFVNRHCQYKRKIKTEETAVKLAAKFSNPNAGIFFDAYKCKVCGCWHIGHSKRQFRRWLWLSSSPWQEVQR